MVGGLLLVGGTHCFCLGTAYNVCSMEDIEISWLLCWQWKYTTQNIIISVSKIELWHLYKSPLPSAKGLSIYFYVESSPSYQKAPAGEHRCHLHSLVLVYIEYDLTGSLLPWITMSSQSLIFKGALHLCFAVSKRASEIHFVISYYDCFEKVLSSEIYYYCSLVDYAIDMSKHET